MPQTVPATSFRKLLEREQEQVGAGLRLLEDAADVGDTRRMRDTFVLVSTRLRRLFGVEERFAFARFEGETGLTEAGPTWLSRREHRAIERRMDALWTMMAEPTPRGIPDALRAFEVLVADHLQRENEVLWDVCERLLDGAEQQETQRILSEWEEEVP